MATLTWRQMVLYGRAAERQRMRGLERMMAAALMGGGGGESGGESGGGGGDGG